MIAIENKTADLVNETLRLHNDWQFPVLVPTQITIIAFKSARVVSPTQSASGVMKSQSKAIDNLLVYPHY